jgi:hypothetical protein
VPKLKDRDAMDYQANSITGEMHGQDDHAKTVTMFAAGAGT